MKTAFATASLLLLAACAASPYAGQEARDIKALSDADVRALREGQGMGFAKAAELNGWPGPMHAVEMADGLALTPAQREAMQSLLARHKAQARALGESVLAGERRLDALFASRTATAASIDAALSALAADQARLRGAHLKAHLEATALLTPEQVTRYASLRGYSRHH